MDTYKSFGDLATAHEAEVRADAEKREKERKERFEEIFGGKFDEFPSGNFDASLPGVESISIVNQKILKLDRKSGSGEGAKRLYAVVHYRGAGGEKKREAFWFSREGLLSGSVPESLHFTREQLYDSLLNIGDAIGGGFFEPIGDEILPPGERLFDVGESSGGEQEDGGSKIPDPRRIKFMRKQPGALFGFYGNKSGFDGYRGFVFPDKIILENDALGNAVYVIKFPEELNYREWLNKIVPKKARSAIIEKSFVPFAGLSKKEAREKGAWRVIHPPKGDKEWEQKMEQIVRG